MSEIILGKATNPRLSAKTLDNMFQLRDLVFNQKLGWKVKSHNGRERDTFDDLDPIYMVCVGGQDKVEGCWRLLPTVGPYMLQKTFPELLRGESAPVNRRVWELSRFAIAPSSTDLRQVNLSSTTFEMIRHVYDFAVANELDYYVTVTSVALERLLKKVGIPLRRFGDGEAVRIGKVLSVACWVPIDDEFRNAVYPCLVESEQQRVA